MSSIPAGADIEVGRLRDGYPALAAWIARDPDSETFVFRRFDRLAARNLHHMQSQLFALEKEIDDQDEAARQSPDATARQSSRRFETLMEMAKDPSRPERSRVGKLAELKDKLKEYQEALVLQAQIINMRRPSKRVVCASRDYVNGNALRIPGIGKAPIVSGRAKTFLEDDLDLVTLQRPSDDDVLSATLQDHWIFRRRAAADPLDRTTIHNNRHIVRTVAAISMVVAALLLIGATVALRLVTNEKAKLGIIAGFTFVFALSMLVLTNSRKAEIYGATAAYAAVLVVFVSGDLSSKSKAQVVSDLAAKGFVGIACSC